MPILKSSILEVPQDDAAARLAVLQKSGVGINKCVQILSEEFTFQFTRTQLKRLESRDVYLKTVEEYEKNVVRKAVNELKARTANMVTKIVSAIEQGLDNGDIKAVAPALKILGLGEEGPTQQAQNIQVILPGRSPKDVTPDKS